jgi:hypothetical protein
MSAIELPAQFADLAHFGPEWCQPGEEARHWQRVGNDLETVRAFYETVFPRMDAIIEYLNGFDTSTPADLGPADRNLFYLALTCMEMSHPVDMHWPTTDIEDKFPSERLRFQVVKRNQPG